VLGLESAARHYRQAHPSERYPGRAALRESTNGSARSSAASTELVPVERPRGRSPKSTSPFDGVTSDDLASVVLDALYPSGSVPVVSLPVVFAWRDSTTRLVEEARISRRDER
jgi:hypothetical protein